MNTKKKLNFTREWQTDLYESAQEYTCNSADIVDFRLIKISKNKKEGLFLAHYPDNNYLEVISVIIDGKQKKYKQVLEHTA